MQQQLSQLGCSGVRGLRNQGVGFNVNLNIGISCFDTTRSVVNKSLDDADKVIDPPIPHHGIIVNDAEVCLAEMMSQLQALINSSVAAQWKAVKDAIEMLGVQLCDGNGYQESALAELQKVKHLCNTETTPNTSYVINIYPFRAMN